MTLIPLKDLPLFWQGRTNALRIVDSHNAKSDVTTLEIARVYEECATELRAALALFLDPDDDPEGRGVIEHRITCPSCAGEGRDLRGHPNDPDPKDYGPCDVCGGTGRVAPEPTASSRCPICGKDTPHHHVANQDF
jgi:hypothetical protein